MLRLLLALVLVLVLIGCGGGADVVTLTIDPLDAEVTLGQTTRFTVSVTGTTNQSVTWEATGGQLISKDSGATFVALQTGSFEVTATSKADPEVSATASILVTAPPGQPQLRFVTDGSLVLAGGGVTKRLEVEVIDAHGDVIDTGQVTWSSSDPEVATVVAEGARAAQLTTQTSDTAQALITATFEDLSAEASVLITQPRAGTVLIDSLDVLAKTPDSLTLKRNPVNEALSPGQRVVSSSSAGVLVEVVAVALTTAEVELTTVPTSLAEAFDEFTFAGDISPVEITVQFVDGRSAVVTTRSVGGGMAAATVLDDVTCSGGAGAAAVDLQGTNITVTAELYGELAFSVLLGDDHFLAKFGTRVEVVASTGSVTFGGSGGGTAVCALELPRIGLPPYSSGVFTLWTGLVPILGVEVGAEGTTGSISLSGPHGGISAVLEGGIEYTEAGGWAPITHSDSNVQFEPFGASAALEDTFSARLAPFGRVDIGISLDLGVDTLAAPVIDARFVELKGYGYLDFELPAPVDVGNQAYGGPEWTLGAGTRGALKAEFQGLLPDLLAYLGIDLNFAGQLELFQEELELLTNPTLTFLASPATVEIPAGGSAPVTLTAFTSGEEDGTVSFWASKDGAASLTFLTSAALEGGSAVTSWHADEEGEYTLYARVSTDTVSLVKPYAANNVVAVSVTEDEELDRGPLGNQGPFGGYYTHFSLGACDAIGVALTIDFFEQEGGSLSGTYQGHYCTDSCLDIETYPSGPVGGTLSGTRVGDAVTFTLSAPVGGVFTGDRFVPTPPPGSSSLPVISGLAEGVYPCEDAYGFVNSGFFTFVGSESVE